MTFQICKLKKLFSLHVFASTIFLLLTWMKCTICSVLTVSMLKRLWKIFSVCHYTEHLKLYGILLRHWTQINVNVLLPLFDRMHRHKWPHRIQSTIKQNSRQLPKFFNMCLLIFHLLFEERCKLDVYFWEPFLDYRFINIVCDCVLLWLLFITLKYDTSSIILVSFCINSSLYLRLKVLSQTWWCLLKISLVVWAWIMQRIKTPLAVAGINETHAHCFSFLIIYLHENKQPSIET